MLKSVRRYFQTLLLFLMVCLHLIELGQKGLQGLVGCSTRSIQVKTGTILNQNYRAGNPNHAAIPLGDSRSEPTVIFWGIENENGIYITNDFEAVIPDKYNNKYAVPGTSSWYLMVRDSSKKLVNSNYQVKFVP